MALLDLRRTFLL